MHALNSTTRLRTVLGSLLVAALACIGSECRASLPRPRTLIGTVVAAAGQSVTVPIRLNTDGATVAGFEIAVSPSAAGGTPALSDPFFTNGAQTVGWLGIPDNYEPWHQTIIGATGAQGDVEVLKLSVRVPITAPQGSDYTLSAT